MIICILYKKFEFKNVSAEQYKLHEKVGLFEFCLHWYYHRKIVILFYVLIGNWNRLITSMTYYLITIVLIIIVIISKRMLMYNVLGVKTSAIHFFSFLFFFNCVK